MSPVARRCLRLALAVGIAAAVAYGKGLPFAYLVVIMAATLLVVPNPPPGPKQALILIVLMLVMCGWGLLLGPVLTGVPVAGVLILLLGIGVASALTTRPAVAIVGTLMILGNTIIAVIGQQSSAAGLILLQLLVLATLLAVIIILGPAVEDGANATDIGRQMLTRIAMVIGLSLYAATMVALLDTARARRLVAR